MTILITYKAVNGDVNTWTCNEDNVDHVLDVCDKKELEVIDLEYLYQKPMNFLAGLLLSAQMECLALNVYFEARNQSYNGKLSVSQVVLNRVQDSRYPSTVCGVVYQGYKTSSGSMIRHKCQFSWYCDGKSDVPKEQDAWIKAKQVAQDAYLLHTNGFDLTEGSTHYHTTYVNPYWSKAYTYVKRVDDHYFYRRENNS